MTSKRARHTRRGRRNRAVRRAFGRPVVIAAFVVFALAIVHPPHGTGVNVCLWSGLTDMPCPGCGMTRSVSCAVRGQFADSVAYHPFGIVLSLLLVSAAALGLAPGPIKRNVLRRLLERAHLVNAVYVLAVAGFVTFGVARVVWMLV